MTAAPRIAILTPDPAGPAYGRRWRAPFAALARALAGAGAEVRPCPWTEAPAEAIDLHLPLLAWGYHRDAAAWRARLEDWPADRPLVNAPPLLLWNTDKRYLRALEDAGAPIVPTRFAAAANEAELAAAAAGFATTGLGADGLVVKPQVSAGAHATVRLEAGADGAGVDLPDGPVMIQPFLPAVREEGELSLVMLAGQPAYAVRKRPAAGDFRVQVQHGGLYTRAEITADMAAVAAAALAACPQPPAYARVDMVRDSAGRLRLMELELIEPDLYLPLAPDAAPALAAALLTGA